MALCLQCSRRDIVQHCVSHNSTSSDIVMSEEMLAVATLSSSEASKEEEKNIIIRAGLWQLHWFLRKMSSWV